MKAVLPKIIRQGRQRDIRWYWGSKLLLEKLEGRFSLADEQLFCEITFIITGAAWNPLHGRLPVHISTATQPTLQMSTFASYPWPSGAKTSGAIQYTVPFIIVYARPPRYKSSAFLLMPKSEILQTPSSSTKMLSAFRSCSKLSPLWLDCSMATHSVQNVS